MPHWLVVMRGSQTQFLYTEQSERIVPHARHDASGQTDTLSHHPSGSVSPEVLPVTADNQQCAMGYGLLCTTAINLGLHEWAMDI